MRPAGETDRNLALDSAIKRGVRKPFGQEAADFQGLARSLDADPEVAKAQGAQFALAALGRPAYDRTKGPPPFVTRLGVDALNQWRTAQGFAPRNSGLLSQAEEATLAADVQTAALKPGQNMGQPNRSGLISEADARALAGMTDPTDLEQGRQTGQPWLHDGVYRPEQDGPMAPQEAAAPAALGIPVAKWIAGLLAAGAGAGAKVALDETGAAKATADAIAEALPGEGDAGQAATVEELQAAAEAQPQEAARSEAEAQAAAEAQSLEETRHRMILERHGILNSAAPKTQASEDDPPTHTGHPSPPSLGDGGYVGPSTDPDPRLTERPPGFGEGGVIENTAPVTPIPVEIVNEPLIFVPAPQMPLWFENRKGDPRIQDLNSAIGANGVLDGWKFDIDSIEHVNGGYIVKKGQRIDLSERYFPAQGKNKVDRHGKRNASYIDVTLEVRKGDCIAHVHINTVDVYADGQTPKPREQRQADKMQINKDAMSVFIMVPKPPDGADVKKFADQKRSMVEAAIAEAVKLCNDAS